MTFNVSKPLWELFPVLQLLQFPATRLHAPAAVLGLYALLWWYYQVSSRNIAEEHSNTHIATFLYSPFTMLIMIALVYVWSFHHMVNMHGKYSMPSPHYAESYRELKLFHTRGFEYIPKHIAHERVDMDYFRTLAHTSLLRIEGKGTVQSIRKTDEEWAIGADVTSDTAQLIIKQWYFPFWRLTDQAGRAYTLSYQEDGLMTVLLPKGSYVLTLTFGAVKGERVGWIISLITIAGLAGFAMVRRRYGNTTQHNNRAPSSGSHSGT